MLWFYTLAEIDPAFTWDKVTLTGFAVAIVFCFIKGWIVPGYVYNQAISENERLRNALGDQQQLVARATDTAEQAVKVAKST